MWLQIRTGSRHGPVFSRKKGDCTEHSEHPVSGIFYLVVFAGADKKCIPLSYCMFLFFPVKAGPLAFDYIDLVLFLVSVKRGMPARQKFHDAERVGGAAVISREDKPGCHPGKTGAVHLLACNVSNVFQDHTGNFVPESNRATPLDMGFERRSR